MTEKAGFARAHCLCCFVSTRSTAQRIFGPEWPEEPALSVPVLFGTRGLHAHDVPMVKIADSLRLCTPALTEMAGRLTRFARP